MEQGPIQTTKSGRGKASFAAVGLLIAGMAIGSSKPGRIGCDRLSVMAESIFNGEKNEVEAKALELKEKAISYNTTTLDAARAKYTVLHKAEDYKGAKAALLEVAKEMARINAVGAQAQSVVAALAGGNKDAALKAVDSKKGDLEFAQIFLSYAKANSATRGGVGNAEEYRNGINELIAGSLSDSELKAKSKSLAAMFKANEADGAFRATSKVLLWLPENATQKAMLDAYEQAAKKMTTEGGLAYIVSARKSASRTVIKAGYRTACGIFENSDTEEEAIKISAQVEGGKVAKVSDERFGSLAGTEVQYPDATLTIVFSDESCE